MRRIALLATLVVGGALAIPAVALAGERFYAVDEANRLVTFSSDAPRAISRSRITGLAAGEQVLGLDVRPATGQLYALGSTARLYRIDPATRAATAVGPGPFAPGLDGERFGFDFNPTVDRIRLTSNRGQNVRLHPDTGAVAATDGRLAYAAADAAAGTAPVVVGSGYTNSVAGATSTTLYDLDASRDTLVTQVPPNNGTLNTVGRLGVDVSERAAFDISAAGVAYAVSERQRGGSTLYRVDLASGAATAVGDVGGGARITALAAAGQVAADTSAPRVEIVRVVRAARAVYVRVRCGEACTFAVRLVVRGRVVAVARRSTDLAGSVSVRLAPGRAALRPGAASVTVAVTDASANASRSSARVIVTG